MKEGRIVLIAFGAAAVLMLGFPLATVLMATRPVPPDQGLDGALSKAFLTERGGTGPDVSTLLPKGMNENAVFDLFAASGFTCATDSNAATCFRSHAVQSCKDDWKVRVIFKSDGTLWSSHAEKTSTCL